MIGLEQIYFASGGIGFVYIVGSAMMGHLGGHGHGHGGHHGGHVGHTGHAPGGHMTGGHSATLSGHGGHAVRGPGGPAVRGPGGTGHAGGHAGGHGTGHSSHGGAHGSQSQTSSHSSSHNHGHHGDTAHGDEQGGSRLSKAELGTTLSNRGVRRDKSSTAFFTMMQFLNPMRASLILFLFGFCGLAILRTVPIIGDLSCIPAGIVAYFSSNIFLGLLGKAIGKLERTESYRKEDAIGTVGQLSVPILPGATGEITFVSAGGKTAAPAKAMSTVTQISKMSKVIISDIRDGVYYVEEWNEEEGIAVIRP